MSRRTNLLRTSTVAVFAGITAATVLPPHAGATEPDRAAPVGMIAIGHSGLTGENSDPERPGQPAPANSWATGTNPDVASVYLRLVAAQPQHEGHVANTAVGGALASSLVDQARTALGHCPCTAVDGGIEPRPIGRAPAALHTPTFLLRCTDGMSIVLNVNSNETPDLADIQAVVAAVRNIAAAAR